MQILNNIQKIRWERSLSLRELSKLSGVSHTEIAMLENGQRKYPSQLTMLRLSKALNMELSDVFHTNWRDINFTDL